jgi:hypothetical protein
MTETFYRLHRADTPEFSTGNAWSGPWGETFSADGSRYECRTCDGTGEVFGEQCTDCDGEGWIDCDPGYSCCHTADDLLDYFGQHCPAAADDPIVVFEGQQIGTGFDGEPLAIPTGSIHWITIAQLRREA